MSGKRAVAEDKVIPMHTGLVVGCCFVFLAVSDLQKWSHRTKGEISPAVQVAQPVCITFGSAVLSGS